MIQNKHRLIDVLRAFVLFTGTTIRTLRLTGALFNVGIEISDTSIPTNSVSWGARTYAGDVDFLIVIFQGSKSASSQKLNSIQLDFEALDFTDNKVYTIFALSTVTGRRVTVFTTKRASRKTGTIIDANRLIKLTLVDAESIFFTLPDTVIQIINALLSTSCSKFLFTISSFSRPKVS